MKKLMILLSICGLLFATDIKHDKFFVNINGGKLKIHNTSNVIGTKIGYYFYDPNIYKINNRICIDVEKVDSNADFYISTLKLDWIKNTSRFFAPFVGINLGYLYYDSNGNDYSTNAWGGQAGVLLQITKNFNLEIEGTYQKAFQKKKLWNTALKTLKAGIEFNF
jgi:hypothetical protein